MLRHLERSPSCVEIFQELAAQSKLKGRRELRLLPAYEQMEKDDQKAGKEKKRRQGHNNGRAKKKYRKSAGEEQLLYWAQCDTCDKWRVVPDVITGRFECAMVVLSCDTAEDEEP